MSREYDQDDITQKINQRVDNDMIEEEEHENQALFRTQNKEKNIMGSTMNKLNSTQEANSGFNSNT